MGYEQHRRPSSSNDKRCHERSAMRMIRVLRSVRSFRLRCSCDLFAPNWNAIHESCEHAALNGIPIKLPKISYCPWCGGRVPPKVRGKTGMI